LCLENAKACREPVELLVKRLRYLRQALPEIVKKLELDFVEAFGMDNADLVPLSEWIDRFRLWQSQMESLSKWVTYSIRRHRLASGGLADLAEQLHSGRMAGDSAEKQFRVAYYESLVKYVFESNEDLAAFDGKTFDHWIDEFRELDQRRIEMAKLEVALAHYERVPRGNDVGEIATIRREIEKKRKLKPIRVLLKEAGNAVQAIKPVFMMSPISVAQFLEPGSLEFDLLIIDEASQVSPVDAFGAIARARQVVVVGDSKQLPPTRFFTKMLDDDLPPGDDDSLDAGDMESILGLCVAQGVLQRMLRWHYRSRHHSLIEVSNREFYDNNLYVVPSPNRGTDESGLHFRAVRDGVFDRGGTATNRIEAKAVAQAVVEHARRFPKQSLGVGAFSVAQRDAIRDELELLLRTERGLDEFFARGRDEPFFIKNLENIQGDERDVIFISVGYSRDSSGFMAMNFGPLSSDGGERRLNVLISRARDRCEVFSSITADDIDLDRGRSRGTAAFKVFLGYAETGVLDSRAPLGREYDSDFERQVANSLMGLGFDIHCQVGTSGFIIDLAVVDSDCPGRYLLGIECDGATYHSSRSARDRDRLREQVLRDRGWRIHRIWSTDWFLRPEEQLRKVVTAIENAKCVVASRNTKGNEPIQPSAAIEFKEIIRETDSAEAAISNVVEWSVPYVEAAEIAVPSGTPVHMVSSHKLAEIVEAIVKVESPVHRDEIARRITSLWGQQRTGSRITEAVANAIEIGGRTGKFDFQDGFVSMSGQVEIAVRNREAVSALTLRKPEMIPPAEVRVAIVHLFTQHIGIRRDEVRVFVGRLLGFKNTSVQVKSLIDTEIERLLGEGSAMERDGKLFEECAKLEGGIQSTRIATFRISLRICGRKFVSGEADFSEVLFGSTLPYRGLPMDSSPTFWMVGHRVSFVMP
jgi:very-short-patch-repair endonuclease